jgi:[ribosomal protein S18]-alanine N-acetyltransferase
MMATAQVEVRAMHLADLAEVQRVDRLVYPAPWSLAFWRQELADATNRYYVVALLDDAQVGHAGIMNLAGEGHVSTVAVDPAVQGRGVGARLLVALHRWAIAQNLDALTLEVRVSNAAAVGLYRRFGYAPAGVRKNYYSDEGEDALVMWLHDLHGPAHAALLDVFDGEPSR